MPSTRPEPYFTTELVAPRFIEQRYHPTVRFTPAVLFEARKARERITRKGACAIMIVVPPEIPVDASSSNDDHFREESDRRSIVALAVVAENPSMYSTTQFYLRYYPQSFETKVFAAEKDARKWLEERLGNVDRSGSPVQKEQRKGQ